MNRYIMSGRVISDKYPPRDYANFRSDCPEKFSFKTGILLSLQISSKTWSICLLTSNIIQKTCWIISTTFFLIPSIFCFQWWFQESLLYAMLFYVIVWRFTFTSKCFRFSNLMVGLWISFKFERMLYYVQR